MKTNMGMIDRLLRLAVAATLAVLYFSGVIPDGFLAWTSWIVGVLMVITAIIGFCPLYVLFGINTVKKRGARVS